MSAHQLGPYIAAIATPATGKAEPMLQILAAGCAGQIICGRDAIKELIVAAQAALGSPAGEGGEA